MTTDNQPFDLVAADGLRLSYTPIRDWTMLHPELRGTPFQLYAIMRSLVIDKAGERQSRRITIDQLCWLLPGINGKPTSETAVKDALKALDRLGLVTNPDSERLVTSTGRGGIQIRRRFQINDVPPEGFQGWRNAWDKLDSYREDWRTSGPNGLAQSFEGRNSDPRTDQGEEGKAAGRFKGRNSGVDHRNSGVDHRNSAKDHDLTSRNAPLKKSLKKGSLSTVTAQPNEPGPKEPREREDLGEPNTPDPAELVVQAWIEAWARTRSGAAHPVKAPDAICRTARELLNEGEDPELLRLAAADMATHGWNNLRKHLEYWTPPKPEQSAPGVPGRTAADCTWCDQFGWYEHESGRDARCTHPEDPPPGHPAATQTRSAA